MGVLFCTITTKYRLYQCAALYSSLRKFMPDAVMEVLCMDEESSNVLSKSNFTGIRIITLDQLENEKLIAVKKERNISEYCWTMKPILVQYLFDKYKYIEIVAFLDSDLFFFDNPMKVFAGRRRWNIMLTTHRISRKANSGFIAFKRSHTTSRVINWWKKQCLEWCFMRFEERRFGDQGYLDSFRGLFKGIKYLDMPGVNIAPWNCFNYDFSVKDGRIYIGKCRLIFFHFSGFRLKEQGYTAIQYESEIPGVVLDNYHSAVREAIENISSINNDIAEAFYMGM